MAEEIPFIGREDELARLDALIRQWGTLQVVCISGPGGIGKTRLLQEVRQRATSFESLILPAKVTNKITIGFVQEFSASEWGEQFVIGIREMTGELGIDLIETDANFDLDKMVTNLA
jgi:predicted ATPase